MGSRVYSPRAADIEAAPHAFEKMIATTKRTLRPAVITLKRWGWKLLPYRPLRMTQADWEAQYASGRCDYYRDISELARYCVVAGYCHYLKPAGAILDLGCGEGILQERLYPDKYSRYVGVDFSSEAINRAAHKQDEKTLFVTADISTYSPNEKFDVIVFSECIMCFREPLSILQRYDNFMKADGLFIVSIASHGSTIPIWEIIEHAYPPTDEMVVSHKLVNLSWIIKVYESLQGKE